MTSQFPGLKLRDFIENLKNKGKDEEAEYWRLTVALELGMKQKIKEEEVLDMELDKVFYLMQLPPEPEGWDNWWWGPKAIGRSD